MPETEIFCANCRVTHADPAVPQCVKCGGKDFKVRLVSWAKPLTFNDKRLLRSLGIQANDPTKEIKA